MHFAWSKTKKTSGERSRKQNGGSNTICIAPPHQQRQQIVFTILSGVFTNRVQLSGSSTKYGIPRKRLNSYIVRSTASPCASRSRKTKKKPAIVYSTEHNNWLVVDQFEINYFFKWNNSSIIAYYYRCFQMLSCISWALAPQRLQRKS